MSEKHIAEQFEFKLDRKPGKPVYSYSMLETAKCGRRYYYSKSDPFRETTYNLVAGRLLDTAFNAYYENNDHLKESHQSRLEYARAAVDLLLKEHPDWYKLEWSQKAGDVRSSPENYLAWLFDLKALELVCRHDRGPVEVQKKVELELPDYKIVGYIDCIETDTNTVVDVKAVTGWSQITELNYALRSQVPLYRMILSDSLKMPTKGRYELLLCRKSPKLSVVEDYDIEFLQEKLIKDFDEHHQRITLRQCYDRNPAHCFDFNHACSRLLKCWPELKKLTEPKTN